MQRLTPVLIAALSGATILAMPSSAQAGPSCFTKLSLVSWVTHGRRGAACEVSSESKAVVRRPHSLYKWDLGAWVGGMGIHPAGQKPKDGQHEDLVGFDGMGIQARYRMRRNWGLELSLGALNSEGEQGTERDMFPFTASLMYYLTPTSLFQFYGLAGLGIAPTRWYDSETDATIGASTAGIAQAGVGVALDLHPLRLNADIRGLGMKPSLGDEDGPPTGSRVCTDCGVGEPADMARNDPNEAFAGTSVHLGASFVF